MFFVDRIFETFWGCRKILTTTSRTTTSGTMMLISYKHGKPSSEVYCSTALSPHGDRPKTHVQKSISTGTHDAKTLRAKARERAAKGSRKVQKSVPTTSL